MALRVLVAEDDALARIGLTSILSGHEPTIQLIGVAENGRSALKMAKSLRPDVIITDVRMPVMDGIELVREVRRLGLPTRVLFLSAYSDFEYARESIRLGVDDYLLKLEINDDQLISYLLKMDVECSDERIACEESLERMRVRNMHRILTGAISSDEDIAEALSECSLDIGLDRLMVVVAKCSAEAKIAGKDISHILCGCLNDFGQAAIIALEGDIFAGLVNIADEDADAAGRLTRSVTDYAKCALSSDIRFLVAGPVKRYSDIDEAVRSLILFDGWRYSLIVDDQPPELSGDENTFKHELNDLQRQIVASNSHGFHEAMRALIRKIEVSPAVPTKVLHSLCYMIIYFADSYVDEQGLLPNEWNRSREMLELIQFCRQKQDYVNYLNALALRIEALFPTGNNCAVLAARAYMLNHYMQSDLSLEVVADYVGLTSAYLSRLFGKHNSGSFIDVLTGIRLERAKCLLSDTDRRVSDVGNLVGYPNPYYFSRLFKKNTGMTPMTYRNLARDRQAKGENTDE
jgi:two-component system response regulator YesN